MTDPQEPDARLGCTVNENFGAVNDGDYNNALVIHSQRCRRPATDILSMRCPECGAEDNVPVCHEHLVEQTKPVGGTTVAVCTNGHETDVVGHRPIEDGLFGPGILTTEALEGLAPLGLEDNPYVTHRAMAEYAPHEGKLQCQSTAQSVSAGPTENGGFGILMEIVRCPDPAEVVIDTTCDLTSPEDAHHNYLCAEHGRDAMQSIAMSPEKFTCTRGHQIHVVGMREL